MANLFAQQNAQTVGNLQQQAGGYGASRIPVALSAQQQQQGLSLGNLLSQIYGQSVNQAQTGQQLAQSAGTNIAGMGTQAQQNAITGTQAELSAGTAQQQQQQNQLNALYQNVLQGISWPFQTNQYLGSMAAGVTPSMGGSGITSGNTKSSQASTGGLGKGMTALGGKSGGGSIPWIDSDGQLQFSGDEPDFDPRHDNMKRAGREYQDGGSANDNEDPRARRARIRKDWADFQEWNRKRNEEYEKSDKKSNVVVPAEWIENEINKKPDMQMGGAVDQIRKQTGGNSQILLNKLQSMQRPMQRQTGGGVLLNIPPLTAPISGGPPIGSPGGIPAPPPLPDAVQSELGMLNNFTSEFDNPFSNQGSPILHGSPSFENQNFSPFNPLLWHAFNVDQPLAFKPGDISKLTPRDVSGAVPKSGAGAGNIFPPGVLPSGGAGAAPAAAAAAAPKGKQQGGAISQGPNPQGPPTQSPTQSVPSLITGPGGTGPTNLGTQQILPPDTIPPGSPKWMQRVQSAMQAAQKGAPSGGQGGSSGGQRQGNSKWDTGSDQPNTDLSNLPASGVMPFGGSPGAGGVVAGTPPLSLPPSSPPVASDSPWPTPSVANPTQGLTPGWMGIAPTSGSPFTIGAPPTGTLPEGAGLPGVRGVGPMSPDMLSQMPQIMDKASSLPTDIRGLDAQAVAAGTGDFGGSKGAQHGGRIGYQLGGQVLPPGPLGNFPFNLPQGGTVESSIDMSNPPSNGINWNLLPGAMGGTPQSAMSTPAAPAPVNTSAAQSAISSIMQQPQQQFSSPTFSNPMFTGTKGGQGVNPGTGINAPPPAPSTGGGYFAPPGWTPQNPVPFMQYNGASPVYGNANANPFAAGMTGWSGGGKGMQTGGVVDQSKLRSLGMNRFGMPFDDSETGHVDAWGNNFTTQQDLQQFQKNFETDASVFHRFNPEELPNPIIPEQRTQSGGSIFGAPIFSQPVGSDMPDDMTPPNPFMQTGGGVSDTFYGMSVDPTSSIAADPISDLARQGQYAMVSGLYNQAQQNPQSDISNAFSMTGQQVPQGGSPFTGGQAPVPFTTQPPPIPQAFAGQQQAPFGGSPFTPSPPTQFQQPQQAQPGEADINVSAPVKPTPPIPIPPTPSEMREQAGIDLLTQFGLGKLNLTQPQVPMPQPRPASAPQFPMPQPRPASAPQPLDNNVPMPPTPPAPINVTPQVDFARNSLNWLSNGIGQPLGKFLYDQPNNHYPQFAIEQYLKGQGVDPSKPLTEEDLRGDLGQKLTQMYANSGMPGVPQGVTQEHIAQGQQVFAGHPGQPQNQANPQSPQTGGVRTTDMPIHTAVSETWQAAGANQRAVNGVLMNLPLETPWDPTLRHPDQPKYGGEAHYAHGLYQEGGGDWPVMEQYIRQHYPDRNFQEALNDPRVQSEFAAWNLQTNHKGVLERMNNAASDEEAARIFAHEYLRPGDLRQRDADLARMARTGEWQQEGGRRQGTPQGGDARTATAPPQGPPGSQYGAPPDFGRSHPGQLVTDPLRRFLMIWGTGDPTAPARAAGAEIGVYQQAANWDAARSAQYGAMAPVDSGEALLNEANATRKLGAATNWGGSGGAPQGGAGPSGGAPAPGGQPAGRQGAPGPSGGAPQQSQQETIEQAQQKILDWSSRAIASGNPAMVTQGINALTQLQHQRLAEPQIRQAQIAATKAGIGYLQYYGPYMISPDGSFSPLRPGMLPGTTAAPPQQTSTQAPPLGSSGQQQAPQSSVPLPTPGFIPQQPQTPQQQQPQQPQPLPTGAEPQPQQQPAGPQSFANDPVFNPATTRVPTTQELASDPNAYDQRVFDPEARKETVAVADEALKDARGKVQADRVMEKQLVDLEAALGNLPAHGMLTAGPGLRARAQFVNAYNAALRVTGLDNNGRNLVDVSQIGTAEEAAKLTTNLGFTLSRTLGAREAMQVIHQAIEAVPGGEMSPTGARMIMEGLRQGIAQDRDYYNTLQQWSANNYGSINGHEDWFNKNFPAEMYGRRGQAAGARSDRGEAITQQSLDWLRQNPSRVNDWNNKFHTPGLGEYILQGRH